MPFGGVPFSSNKTLHLAQIALKRRLIAFCGEIQSLEPLSIRRFYGKRPFAKFQKLTKSETFFRLTGIPTFNW